MNYSSVTYELSAGTYEQLPASTVPEIVFSGRSNVGKSSLINRLLNRKNLARVSSQPGKTVTVNFYKADKCRLVDLPGYGYAKHGFDERNRWGKTIEHYFQSGRNIKLVIQLVDMRHKPSSDDMMMLDFLHQTNTDFIVVLTKSDKLNKTEYSSNLSMHSEIMSAYAPLCVIPFSSVTGEGAEKIKGFIDEKCELSN